MVIMVKKLYLLFGTLATSATISTALVSVSGCSHKIITSSKRVNQSLTSQFGDKQKPLRVVDPWLGPVDVSSPTITGVIALALFHQDKTGILTIDVVTAIEFSSDEKIYPGLCVCVTATFKHRMADIFVLAVYQ